MFGRGMLIDPALVMRLRARSADLAEKNAAEKLRLENGSTVWEDAAKRVSDIRDFLWAAGGGLRSGAVRRTGRTI